MYDVICELMQHIRIYLLYISVFCIHPESLFLVQG